MDQHYGHQEVVGTFEPRPLPSEPPPPPPLTVGLQPTYPIVVKKRVEYVHLSDEQREDLAAMPTLEQVSQAIEADQRRFNALSPEEQKRELAEDAARREAERLARTCETCGCDRDEHGGY